MSIYENAIRYNGMRKEAVALGPLFGKTKQLYPAAKNGISRILSWLGGAATKVNNERLVIQNAGAKEYAKYLGGVAKDIYSKTDKAIQNPRAQQVIGGAVAGTGASTLAGLTALFADAANAEAEGRARGVDAERKLAILKAAKLRSKLVPMPLVTDEKDNNALKYGLTGGGAVLGAGIGAGVAGEGNRIAGGLIGAGVGGGAGYLAHYLAKKHNLV